MSADEILRGELIGLDVKVVKAKNNKLVGLKGRVVDETRNMLRIGDRMITKEHVVLDVEKDGHIIEIDGRLLVGKPEDRVRRVRRL